MLDWLRKRFAGARAPVEQAPDVVRRAWALAEQGEIDEAAGLLRASDDPRHRGILVLLLRKYGRLDEAIRMLEADPDADPARLRQFVGERGGQLVLLLRGRDVAAYPPDPTTAVDDLLLAGHLDQAVEQLKASRLPADRPRLQTLLRELGRTDELRALADNSVRLATLRAEGRVDDLRPRADSGDDEARVLLIEALAKQGQVDELKALATDDEYATGLLVELLGRQEQADDLRPYAAAGNTRARDLLVSILARQGRVEELKSLDDPYAAGKLAELLAGLDRIDEAVDVLRARATSSGADQDWYDLARLLADRGRTAEAIAVLEDRPRVAPELLVELLADGGRVGEALAVLDRSDRRDAPRRAARLRAAHGLLDELRARADAGERPSIDLLAHYLAEHGELEELRHRAVDEVFRHQLVQALGRLRQLDELAALAGGGDWAAGTTWWAAVLADAEDVPAALAEHAAYSSWYAEERGMRRVVDQLAEQARIGAAVAFARAGGPAGEAWVPRLHQDAAGLSGNDDLMATAVEAAVRELLPGEGATTVRVADEGSTFYGDVLASVPELGQVRISLACWTVGTDGARYFGDDPPTDAETRLPPDGTAVTDLRSTVAVLDELARRLKATEPAVAHPEGRHLTITVPMRTVPLTAVPD
ncbi:hypothetical protein [Kribbella sp. DT2]|uniref:hypothetical protein n=1 Tax=Kribbella sp. DT2 TaxID=3393427 RepID=UPI003CEFBE9B